MWQWLLDSLRVFWINVLYWVKTALWDVLQYAHEQLRVLWDFIWRYMEPYLPENARHVMNTTVVADLTELWSMGRWVFPLDACFAIVLITFAGVGIIRAARWLFAMIPTLGG